MKVLVVNDDGYTTEGLKILADAFINRGDQVYIVAPHTHQSGKAMAITVDHGLVVHRHADNIWSVEGTPADCVNYALNILELDVDLVVSGINNGFNVGTDTIYSGTIGAAMEAILNDKKAIAFSGESNNNDVVRKEINKVIDFIFEHDLLSTEYILNVNFYKREMKECKGILITEVGIKKKTRRPYNYNDEQKTDVWAMKNGYISITPLKLGNGDGVLVDELSRKLQNNN